MHSETQERQMWFQRHGWERYGALSSDYPYWMATPGGIGVSDSNFFSHSSYESRKKGSSSGLGFTATTCLSLTQIEVDPIVRTG